MKAKTHQEGTSATRTGPAARPRNTRAETKQAKPPALKESELRYRRLFEAAREGILMLNFETGRIEDVNPYLIKLLGHSRAELLEQELWEVGIFKDSQAGKDAFKALQENASLRYEDLALRTKGGGQIQVEFVTSRFLVGRQRMIQCAIRPVDGRQQRAEDPRLRDKHFRSLFENMLEGYAHCKMVYENGLPSDFVYLHVNQAFEVLTGLKDVVGRRVTEVIPGIHDTNPELFEVYGRVASTGQPERLDTYVEGVKIWLSISVYSPEKGEFVAVFDNITERKQAEDALRMSEEKYRGIFENSTIGIFQSSAEGRFLKLNQEMARIYGYDSPEPMLASVTDIARQIYVEPGQREAFQRRLAENGRVTEFIGQNYRKDGTVIWTSTSCRAVKDRQGKTDYYEGFITDITERKQAEQELLRLRKAVHTSGEVIFMTEPDGLITFVNPAFTELYGHTAAEVVGKTTPRILKAGVMKPEDYALFWRNILSKQVVRGELLNKTKDGRLLTIESSVNPIPDDDGNITGFLAIQRDITERKRAEQELLSRNTELSALYELSRELAGAADLGEMLDLVNRHAVDSLHLTFARVALLEGTDLVTRAAYPVRVLDHDLFIGDRRPITALPHCQVALESNASILLRASDSEIGGNERAALLLDLAQSVYLIPLRVGHAVSGASQQLGLLMLGEARGESREPLTPQKMRLAESISDQAAAAIRRIQLRDETRRRLRQVAALHAIDTTITGTTDLHMILNVILKHTAAELGVDAGSILVLNPHTQILECAADHGFRTTAIRKAQIRLGESFAGRAALERQPVLIPDLSAEPNNALLRSDLAGEDFSCYYGVPLIAKGQVQGVLEVFNRTVLDPDAEWLEFLNALAGQAAIAIDDSALFQGLQRSNFELSAAYDATIEGWSHALDLRDKETEGHTQRVADIAVKLARSYGLSEAELAQVRWGSLLHDIGKMGVPDGILLKTGPLTDEEWVTMKQHPTVAYEMLAPIHYLRLALDIPYCHHEKWDGTGYPRGLQGEQIPLAARIFAVIDVWDALNSDRPYRPAWSAAKAREHILGQSGKHFDPRVVEAFSGMLAADGGPGVALAAR